LIFLLRQGVTDIESVIKSMVLKMYTVIHAVSWLMLPDKCSVELLSGSVDIVTSLSSLSSDPSHQLTHYFEKLLFR